MFRYADPAACPGCRSALARSTSFCTSCGLMLSGPVPQRIFDILSQADRLVAELYAARPAVPVPAAAGPVPAPAGPIPTSPPPLAPLPPQHGVPAWESQVPRTTMSAASVPKILLGLGALCLLVASLVFLAVAWAALGVGGRTGVLIGFTAVTAALTAWVAGRDLRAGAEAFATVTLGLLAIDLAGARDAGWLGSIDDPWFLVLAGTTVAVAATAAARWAATTRVATLVSTEVIAAVAVLVTAVGASLALDRSNAVDVLLAIGVCALGALAGHRLGLRVLAIACAVETAVFWLVLTGVAMVNLPGLSIAHVWGDLAVWPTLAAAALVAAVAVPRSLPLPLRVVAASIAVVLGTLAVTVVAFDESATTVALVELGVVAAYAVLAARLPRPWGWVGAAPSVIAAVGLAISVLLLTATSCATLLAHEPWTVGPLTALDDQGLAWTWPLLLPGGAMGLAIAASTLVRCAGGRPGPLLVPGAVATVVGLALMPPLYAAPLAAALLALLLVTVALLVAATRVGWPVPATAAGGTALLTLGAALANDWTTAVVLALYTAGAVAAEVRGRGAVRVSGAALAPLTGAGLIWTVGHLTTMDVEWRALPVLLVLGTAIVLRPAVERELATAVAGTVAVLASVSGATGIDAQWLAVYLTLASVIATVSSQVNREREPLAWAGLGLLLPATAASAVDTWTTCGVLLVLTLTTLLHELRGTETLRTVARAGTALGGAGLIWTVAELADVDVAWRALPVVLALGIAVVARPVVERELASALAVCVAVSASVSHGVTVDQSWLAVYLTLVGVAATGSSLLHASRRRLAWVGLACFTLAQWIRLQQIGVGTVEAYTLPLAVVLLVVGTVALLRGTRSSLRTLSPGLGLALVPTLLQVMVDPVSLRALLLGLGCVALVVAGLVRGWAAPLLAGAGAGALVVLRQATMADVLPQWMIIGLIGVALTVVGVTWEQRLAEFRRASAYVRRLR